MAEWTQQDEEDLRFFFLRASGALSVKSSLGKHLEKLQAGISQEPGYKMRRPKDGVISQFIHVTFADQEPEVREMFLELMADTWRLNAAARVDRVTKVLVRVPRIHQVALELNYGDEDESIRKFLGSMSFSLCQATKAVEDSFIEAKRLADKQGKKIETTSKSWLIHIIGWHGTKKEAKMALDEIIAEARDDLRRAQHAYLVAKEIEYEGYVRRNSA